MAATESLIMTYWVLDALCAAEDAQPVPRKRRGHRCNTCVLTVWQMHGPETAADSNYETFVQDEEHVTQRGPYCAAASVAGMLLSFAAELGGPEEAASRTTATQEAVVQLMRGFGVPGLERSTARVGNVTWKRAMRMATITDDPGKGLLGGQVHFAPRDLEPCGAATTPAGLSASASDGTEAAGGQGGGEGPSKGALAAESDAMWDRLRSDMGAGARVMYHCANHYTRVFGWRQSLPGVDVGGLGGPVDGPGSEADKGLAAATVGGDSDGEEGMPAASDGGLGRQMGVRRETPEFDWGLHQSSRGTRREVLTAKRGQGPKHWVSWEQVVADVRKHKLHRLFAVFMVDRSSDASAAEPEPSPPPPEGYLDFPVEGVTMVRTLAEAERVVSLLDKVPSSVHHAWDTEVSHIDVKTQGPVGNGRVICASFYCGPEYDFGAGPRVWVDNMGEAEGVLNVFKGFLEDPAKKKAFHNVSFDRHVLFNHGIDVLGLSADTMHMARMWTTSRSKAGGYGLESLSADLLGHRKVPMKERFAVPKLKKDGTPGKDTFLPGVDSIQLDPAARAEWIDYSTYDAEATWRLREVLADKLRERPWAQGLSMLDFYERYIVPFAVVLTDMERAGIRVDVKEHLPRAQTLAEEERATAREEFLRWAEQYMPEARRMNIGSDPQKAHFLFAPCAKAKGRTPRARDAARKRTLAKFGIRRPEAGQHPKLDPDRNEGVLTWEDWKEWVDPEGTMFGEHGEWDEDDSWPPLRPFKVENTEGLVEEGRPRAKKQRDLWVPGLGLEPVEYTAGGWPAASAAVLRGVAGDPTSDPPRYGTAYQHFGGGEPGHTACSALHSLVTVGAIDTMLSNFILPLQTMADADLRVHCSLNLNTDTGRLSARRPNLQNQPALEKDRYQIRKAFCAAPGNKLVIADYGQLELRVLAHMARCKSMIDAFASGGDFHSRTAMGMYDYIRDALDKGECLLEWDESQGTRPKPLLKNQFASERRKAKVLNFSIAYGKTPIGLSQDWGVSLDEAKETLEKWYSDRPEVRQWQEQVLDIARSTGATRTLMGRYRDLPEITSPNRGLRGHAERAAINTPIQGGAADVVMMAMLKIAQDKRLEEMGYKLILQIHDEVILEGPEEHADEALRCLVEDMEHPFAKPLLVDLIADAAIANTWYEGK